MYGIVPIGVVDKNTVLEPQISMPDVLRPEQTVNVKVSEKHGKKMTYTIAVVDEGLPDLTRFKTPNAWESFYTREALGVRTWDIYDDVIGAYGGKVNQVFSIGGDAEAGGGKKSLREEKPMREKNQFELDKLEAEKTAREIKEKYELEKLLAERAIREAKEKHEIEKLHIDETLRRSELELKDKLS